MAQGFIFSKGVDEGGNALHWDPGVSAEQAFEKRLVQESVLLLHGDTGQLHGLEPVQVQEEPWNSRSPPVIKLCQK